jgi:hypothetical protein
LRQFFVGRWFQVTLKLLELFKCLTSHFLVEHCVLPRTFYHGRLWRVVPLIPGPLDAGGGG